MTQVKTHAFRIEGGADLREAIDAYVSKNEIRAGFIVTCVGGLSAARLRMPGASEFLEFDQDFEIVSLVGTLSQDGSHLHVSISDKQGQVIGGHLSKGCVVRLTAELILAEDVQFRFARQPDSDTGFDELVVHRV